MKLGHSIFKKQNICVEIIRMCIVIRICLEENIPTLVVVYNHIEEDYQVMRVKRGSYE